MTEPLVVRGRVVTPVTELADGVVAVDGDTIGYVGRADEWKAQHPERALPEPSGVVVPGLVDIHCHGGGGHAVTTTDPTEALAVAAHHAAYGTTSMVASLVTASPATLLDQVTALAPLVASGDLAGLHLEGPFLSPVRCGAQAPEFLIDPDADLVDRLLDTAPGVVAMMTLAPELPGAGDVAERLRARGVVVALGHSDASHDVFRAALRSLDGTGLVTHLANGMPPLHHRAPGPVAASIAEAAGGRARVELIGDGVHVDPGFVSLVFAASAPGSVVLVTDAMSAAGMADGSYVLGPQRVEVREGVARLAGSADSAAPSSIAGGTSHLVEVLARTVHDAGVPLVDAVRAATLTPATVLGLADRVGTLEPGRAADLLVLDDRMRRRRVLRKGEWLS